MAIPICPLNATQSLTGEDRGEGAYFCPLTLILSRQGRENTFPCIVRQAKYFAEIMFLLILALTMGCDRLPGKPTPEERWKRATEVTDFSQLYALNCSGCHGADGRFGAARPLNDPLYLALVSNDTLHQAIAQGVPGTAAPAFAQQVGGPLTDIQIDILIEGMRSRWGKAENFQNVALPPYRIQDARASSSEKGEE